MVQKMSWKKQMVPIANGAFPVKTVGNWTWHSIILADDVVNFVDFYMILTLEMTES